MINEKSDYDATSSNPTSSASATPPRLTLRARRQAPARSRFKSAVLNVPHLNQVAREPAGSSSAFHKEERHHNEDHGEEEDAVVSSQKPSGGKHHWKKNWNKKPKKNGYEYSNENEYQYDRYGRQIQPGSSQQQAQQLSVSEHVTERNDGKKSRIDDRHGDYGNSGVTMKASASPPSSKPKKDYKRVSTLPDHARGPANTSKSSKIRDTNAPQPTPILIPKGETGRSRSDTTERQKHPRLRGADLYVTRMGWSKANKKAKPKAAAAATSATETGAESDLTSSITSLPGVTSNGSLHDELRDPSPRPSRFNVPAAESPFPCSTIHASRPCYRCVSYMHSVGIKRVFWTNDAGEWEGGKVAKLAQALECTGEGGGEGGPLGNGVFVTKHEVLMLKRMMG